MRLTPITEEQKHTIQSYLRGYTSNRKLLKMDRYEQQFFSDRRIPNGMPSEIPLARAVMFDVRHFILSLENGDEKLFLYYHYIKEENVANCAELLGISERACYRLKNRALTIAYRQKFSDCLSEAQ